MVTSASARRRAGACLLAALSIPAAGLIGPLPAAAKASPSELLRLAEYLGGPSGGLKARAYGKPSLRIGDGGVRIDGDGAAPAGLFLRFELDPQRRYRLVIQGRGLAGTPTLRLRADGGEPDYRSPAARTELVLLPTAELEVLIYGDQAFAYLLVSARVEECAGCMTEAERWTRVAERLRGTASPLLVSAAPYNLPEARFETGGVVVSGGGSAPAGVFLQFELEPTRRYRLVIEGETVAGLPTLRLRSDDGTPAYGTLGRATEDVVDNTSKLEVLIYGDRVFAYRLASVRVEECPGCMTAVERWTRVAERLGGGGDGRRPVAEAFGRPSVELAADGVTVSGGGESGAGVFLRYDLEPTRRYRLALAAEGLIGQISARLRRDGGEPVYRPLAAADGWLIADTAELEVLLYGDEPFSLRLRSALAVECPTCPVDADLRAFLLAEIPRLEEDGAGDLERALLLLDWVSRATDWADAPALIRESLHYETAAEIFDVFEGDRGAVYCSGAAVFLDKVLKLFGLESFTVNFGDRRADLTHVAVILALTAESERTRYYLLDPTINGTFHEGISGRLVTVAEMLDAATSGRVVVRSRPLAARDFHMLPRQRHLCPSVREERADLLICSKPGYGLDYVFGNMAASLEANGYSREPVRAYLELLGARVFGLGKSVNPANRDGFVALLRGRGVAVEGP